MNKEITIYNLLGLIKDNKAPKKIKYDNRIWVFDLDEKDYSDGDEALPTYLFLDYICVVCYLNEKVEIIEDEEENKNSIEEINLSKELQTMINSYDIDIIVNAVHSCLTKQTIKINELSRELNKLRKEIND